MLGSTEKESEYLSAAFAGVRFCLYGFDPLNGHQVREKLIEGGGIDAGHYSSDCTHVIVHKIVYDDPICLAARSDGKTLVTGLWVDHSYDIGMPVDPSAIMYRPLRDLNGIPGAKSFTVCLTGYQRQDRDDIMTMVGLMGAQFSKPLVASKITHLICYKFEGEKYELAKKITRIKLVNHRWLEDCLSAWEILPESNYVKSGHEMEMDAEAKDSDEDVANDNNNEQNSMVKIGGSHTKYVGTLRTNPSPLSAQNFSRPITPTRTNPSPLSKQEVSITITPMKTNPSSPSKQDVSRTITLTRTNPSPLSKQDVSRTITPTRTNPSPQSKQVVSRNVTPINDNQRVITAQEAISPILATGEGVLNNASPRQLILSKEPVILSPRASTLKSNGNQDVTSIGAFDKSPASNNAQRFFSGSSKKTLNNSCNDELYHEDKQTGISLMKRTVDVPCNSSKLKKTSQNLKATIFEPPLQFHSGGLGPEDNYDRSLMTNSSVSSANKAQHTPVGSNPEHTPRARSLMLDSSVSSKMLRTFQPPGNVSLFNEEMGNKSASTSGSRMLKDSTELPKYGNADSLSKPRKEVLAKKCLGSRSKLTPYSTENQKGSSRGTVQSSLSVEEVLNKDSREVETKSAVVETNVAEINGDDAKNASLDDETEAPDMNEEDEIAVKEVQDKYWVEPAADPVRVANEEESLPQNEPSMSKVDAAKSKKRPLEKMSNMPVHSLSKTKKPKVDSHEMIAKGEKKDEMIEKMKVQRSNSSKKKPNDDSYNIMAGSKKIDEIIEKVKVKRSGAASRKKPTHLEKMEESVKNDEMLEEANIEGPNAASRKKPNDGSHNKMAGSEKIDEMVEQVKVKRLSAASRKKPNDLHKKMEESEKNDETLEEANIEGPNAASRKKPNDDSHAKMAQSEKKDETIEKVKVKRSSAASRKKPNDVHDKVEESGKNDEPLEEAKVERSTALRKKPDDDSHAKMAQSEKKDETIEKVEVKRPSAASRKKPNDVHEKVEESGKNDETLEEVKVGRPTASRKRPKDDTHAKMAQSEKRDDTIEKVKVKRPCAASRKKPIDAHEKLEETEKIDETLEEVKVERPTASRKKPKDDSHVKMAESEEKDETNEMAKVKRPNTSRKKKSVPAKVVENLTEVGKENRPLVGNKNISENLQQVGEVIPKLNESTVSVAARTEPTCFILTGHRFQRKEFKQVIRRLKGKFCKDSHQWSYQATHLIVPDPLRRTEKFFAAAASGRWILKTDYLSASNEAGRFLDEKAYEWHKKGLSEDGAINLEAPRKWRLLRERTGHGAFYGMRIIVYGECIAPSLDTLKRAMKAGDGVILATSPPYNRFLKSGVDFAVISPGMPRVDIWVQEFINHEIPCISADYLVEYVCKPGYPLDRHVQYNTQVWADRSLKRLAMMSEERVVEEEEPKTPECDDDLACQACGCRDRGEEMLICGDEMGTVGCGVGMHLDCCDPPLESVPEDDWLCGSCCKTVSLGKRKKKGK